MSTQSTKMTPMLEQYLQIKEHYPDALLFFRMGDFYELFFDDAEVAARELQIALTSRNPKAELKVPMCGVPYHAVQEYLRPLLERRYKVAICDQLEDPGQAKGLVRRAVTRVLTPGTVVEDYSLQAKMHNFLAALCFDAQRSQGGLAWIDFSTGDWTGFASKNEQELWSWVHKIDPPEIICPEGLKVPERSSELKERITWLPEKAFFHFNRSRDLILEAQEAVTLDTLDLEDKPGLVRSCGALVAYLQQTQKQTLDHLDEFRPMQLNKHLILDEVTERNLELFQRLDGGKGQGTLWHVVDHTKTPMGGRLLQEKLRHPWREIKPILRTQAAVAFFAEQPELRDRIRPELDAVFDLERLCTRIMLNRCSPKDFIFLRSSLERLPRIRHCLQDFAPPDQLPEDLDKLVQAWDDVQDLTRLLAISLRDNPPQTITEGGLFQPGYDQRLDELIDLTEHGETRLKDLQAQEQQAHDLPKLKLGFNRVFGYYFELSKAHKGPVPEHFHRRQTLVNSERYVTDELKALEEKLFSASEQKKNLEFELFQDLRQKVLSYRQRITSMAERVGLLDYWQGLGHTASVWEWVCPQVHTGLDINITQARHPAVEAAQGRTNYIPNDIHITEKGTLLLITGPNMAGKSTVLRQTAIISILAQIGSFVPAASCSLGLADRIFTRVGASDNLAQGQSTFMVEMTETARILRQAGKRSLVILDEIGRGTSTYDGLSLAWAVVENLAGKYEHGIRTLFATHYHELTELEGKIPAIRNFNIAVKEWKGEIIFLRRLVPGPADRSYGIEVAKLAGVPQPVISRAKEILAQLEQAGQNMKSRGASGKKARQSLLPGLLDPDTKQKNEPDPSPHPLVSQLDKVDVHHLSPVQALNLIHEWKQQWGNNDHN
ncbi:MAG: DNA mismatch repair protein MutS [Desulfovermiculus sp.]